MRHASTESETNMQNQGAAKLESLAGSSRPRGCFDVAYSPQKEGRLGAWTTLGDAKGDAGRRWASLAQRWATLGNAGWATLGMSANAGHVGHVGQRLEELINT